MDRDRYADGKIRDQQGKNWHSTEAKCAVLCLTKRLQTWQKNREQRARLPAWSVRPSWMKKLIFAIGNAPTALIRLYEMIQEGRLKPELIIGVPVGFVNVVQSKELILSLNDTPYIVARGRKGGSNIAACICNALLYMMDEKK